MAGTTWNPSDKTAGAALSGGNLTVTATASGNGVRTIGSQTSGKWYWETTVQLFSSSSTGIGLGNASAVLATVGATPINAALVYSSGNIWVNNANAGGIGALTNGVVICHAVDLGARLYWMRNGAAGNWNGNSANNPATGVGGLNIASIASSSVPTFGLAGLNFTSTAAQVIGNFGDSAFTGAVPAGFTSGFPAATTQAAVRVMVQA